MANYLLVPVREIARFIIWWIARVPAKIAMSGLRLLIALDSSLALKANLVLWLKLEPVFGEYGWQGRLIGVFLRGIRLLVSLFAYLLVIGGTVVCLLVWYAVVPACIYLLFNKPV